MGLEDFERELAAEKESRPKSGSSKPRDDERRHKHRHHHKSRHDDQGSHRRKRSRDRSHRDRERDDKHRSKRLKSASPQPTRNAGDEEEDEWVEKEAMAAPPTEDILDGRGDDSSEPQQRDSWMQAPSTLDVDYLQRSGRHKSPPSQFVTAKESHGKKIHAHEMEQLMRDLEDDEEEDPNFKDEPAQHEVLYTFGDSGSQWRMTKLKAVYRQAKDEGRPVDEVALDRYGDLRDFDDAREEERELSRRDTYGKDYVGLEKPSGEFFQERKLAAGIREQHDKAPQNDRALPEQGKELSTEPQPPPGSKIQLDQTALNKLKAKMMKAKLRKDPSAADLEAEYNAAVAASANGAQSDTVVLSNMDNRLLAGGRGTEVSAVTNKRGLERGTVTENSEMSIADMVRHERRTRNTSYANEGLLLANRIAKDTKFTNDLEYMNDNAEKLATRDIKSDTALRSTAVSNYQHTQRILDTCPLCHHEDRNEPPTAPLISLGTRTYLTLATEPELVRHGTVIVPVQHRSNLLECDDDEWEEIRNFQKSLTRLYASQDRGVIFYENAASSRDGRRHAALNAVPLPHHLVDAAPGFFKEAILASDEEWSQHRKIVDTAQGARERYGKAAFRKMMVKEMPYFHVWFGMDGGAGHVVEDERRWPKGDLFAREVLGGMLDRGVETVKRQGRWVRRDHRVEGFRKKWDAYDWTKVLLNGQ
ncbi:putative cell cycle control protein [Elsinoe ampelina]|uniref:Putative cell cycle control protein n=1 Tax=Elsinoe ampelina TaxID=302913 RepID=A0A6A6G6C2_9PEZI|nr:putative cell cycle control protein [Elsinoe ampelina]